MTCPRSDQIARLIAEDLPVAEARTLEQHMEGCAACSERREATMAVTGALGASWSGLEDDKEAFVGDTMRRLDVNRPTTVAPWKLLAAAAVVLLSIPLGYLGVRHLSSSGEGTFTARGQQGVGTVSSELERLVGIEPLLVRRGQSARPVKENDTLRSTDGLTFRYSNLARRSLYMMAFAVDSTGEVHWFYPAYLDATTNPRAVLLAPQKRQKVLPEVVQPEGVAAGPLRVVTLVMARPLTVQQVEKRVVGSDPRQRLEGLPSFVATQQWLVGMEASDVQ